MKQGEPEKVKEPEQAVPDKIVIEIMSGPEDGRTVVCDSMPISIGRASDNTVRLVYDHLISRHHARIVEAYGNLVLCDLNSTNGTFIGSKRVPGRVMLERNRLFRVGATLLVIKLHGVQPVGE